MKPSSYSIFQSAGESRASARLRAPAVPRFRAKAGPRGGIVAPVRGLGVNAFFIGLPKPSKTSVS